MSATKPILVTGAAGFVGFHTATRLLRDGYAVCGLDNLNEYYDVNLKKGRLAHLEGNPKFRFVKMDIADRVGMKEFFAREKFETVLHLAAQAGVRYSVTHPHVYISSNIEGFLNVLEGCRHNGVSHLVYASSSSVYGTNTKLPFSEKDCVEHPKSLYGATKKMNELMAHSYAELYGLQSTGLRYFTVYGPWGRPDMALFLFSDAIMNDRPIEVFNNGNMSRDFTYIDGIVEATVRIVTGKPKSPYQVYNIGTHQPVPLMKAIEILENCWGKKAKKNFREMQLGDVPATFADTQALYDDFGFRPNTPLETGIEQFVRWYREYYL